MCEAAKARSSGWIRNPFWDGLWSLNGLWLVGLLWWLARDHEAPADSPADSAYLVLTLCFWIGHRVGSGYLAYCTSAYRPLLRSQPVRFVVVPILITVAVFTIVLPPDDMLPITRTRRIFWLVMLDYLLVSYHFAGQHYGLLSLYRVRAGQSRDAGARRVDRWYALGIGGVVVIAAEVIAGNGAHQSAWLDPLLDVPWILDHGAALAWSGSALVGLATLALLIAEWRRPDRSAPRALYVVSIAAMVTMAFHVDPLLFLMVWTAQHWLTATGLASRVAAGEPAPGPARWYGFWHRINRRPASVVIVLALASALLMPAMEVEAEADPVLRYSARLVPFFAEWLSQPGLFPVLAALALTTGFVHYALDRAVYRLSDPDVRSAARGLIRGTADVGSGRS